MWSLLCRVTLWHSLAPHCQNPLPLRDVTLKLPIAPPLPPSALPSPSNSTLATSVAQLSPCGLQRKPDMLWSCSQSCYLQSLFTWVFKAYEHVASPSTFDEYYLLSWFVWQPEHLMSFSFPSLAAALLIGNGLPGSVCPYAASFPATTSPNIV